MAKVTIQVDNIQWDGVEWSALHHVHPTIEKAGLEFVMSTTHWTLDGYQGIALLYKGDKLVAYRADGNIARLTCNETGIDLPEMIEVIEKQK